MFVGHTRNSGEKLYIQQGGMVYPLYILATTMRGKTGLVVVAVQGAP